MGKSLSDRASKSLHSCPVRPVRVPSAVGRTRLAEATHKGMARMAGARRNKDSLAVTSAADLAVAQGKPAHRDQARAAIHRPADPVVDPRRRQAV